MAKDKVSIGYLACYVTAGYQRVLRGTWKEGREGVLPPHTRMSEICNPLRVGRDWSVVKKEKATYSLGATRPW